jgi:hypothetical protein
MLTNPTEIMGWIDWRSEEWSLIEQALADPPGTIRFDPLKLGTISRGSEKFNRLQLLIRSYWRIAVAAGQGYQDAAVTSGQRYFYELRGVNKAGIETDVLATDIAITAGRRVKLRPPSGLTADAGDSKVLLLWDDVRRAAGFHVYRATAPAGPYKRINEIHLPARIEHNLNGEPLSPAGSGRNGFVDFQRWDDFGNPISHQVDGQAVDGPRDGTTYFYKVASLDLLGQEGSRSTSPASATPRDHTPPKVTQSLQVFANEPQSRLELKWVRVTHDVEGHLESGILGYNVYRYENPSDPNEVPVLVGSLVGQPAPPEIYVTYSDSDPSLRPAFGEESFWFRVEAVDGNNNLSAPSAAVSGHLKDITPPAPPKGSTAEGHDDFIRIRWKLSSEPDMEAYLIYRSLCHYGNWRPCEKKGEGELPPEITGCGSPFVLVGTLSQDQAEKIASEHGGFPLFDDRTVPAGSPLCYAYLVKAKDRSQNESGSWPLPDPVVEPIVCERLRDRTPPEPAIISGLFARDGSVRVEWIGPPVQDIGAYHVYRSDSENGAYKWVGGATVPIPPAQPVPLTAPYAPTATGCEAISVITQDDMSAGSFLDDSADPKRIYWYKVLGVDQAGNEAPINDAVAISTFTFSRKLPDQPIIVSVSSMVSPCGLLVSWTPHFDGAKHMGFFIYRSRSSSGPFFQISSLVTANSYLDTAVAEGIEYWYRVARLDKKGKVSLLSKSFSGNWMR